MAPDEEPGKDLPVEPKAPLSELKGDELEDYFKNESTRNEHGRREKLLQTLNKWASWTIAVVFAVLIVSAAVVAWHYLAPPWMRWLQDNDLVAIRSYTFSGVIIGAVAGYLKRYL